MAESVAEIAQHDRVDVEIDDLVERQCQRQEFAQPAAMAGFKG